MSSDVIGVNSHAVEQSLDRLNKVAKETATMGKVDVKVVGKLIKTGQAEEPSNSSTPSYSYNAVTPVEGDVPSTKAWYEKSGDEYILSSDSAVDSAKTYYERVEA